MSELEMEKWKFEKKGRRRHKPYVTFLEHLTTSNFRRSDRKLRTRHEQSTESSVSDKNLEECPVKLIDGHQDYRNRKKSHRTHLF